MSGGYASVFNSKVSPTSTPHFTPDLWLKEVVQKRIGLLIELRAVRDKVLPRLLFYDPAWHILPFLYQQRCLGMNVTIKSACLAYNAPMATALRYISALEDAQLISRTPDPRDARGVFIDISSKRAAALFQIFPTQPCRNKNSARFADKGGGYEKSL